MCRIPILAAVILALFIGCVPSLYPLYTKSDLIQNPKLIGSWVNDDETERWEFKMADDSLSYVLSYTEVEKEDSKQFKAHLLQLDNVTYLDTYPDEDIDNDFYKLHLVPAHIFGKVDIAGDTISLSLFDSDWLHDMIVKDKVKIGHENLENGLILTATTGELQRMIVEHANDPKAFSNLTILHRE